MEWLKQNNYVALLLAIAVAFVAYLYITDEKIEQIEITKIAKINKAIIFE